MELADYIAAKPCIANNGIHLLVPSDNEATESFLCVNCKEKFYILAESSLQEAGIIPLKKPLTSLS